MKTLLPLALLLLLLAPACRPPGEPATPPRPVRVTTATPLAPGEGTRFSAALQPRAQVTLAFRASGYVERLATRPDASGPPRPLAPGDTVTRGEEVAALRPRDFQDQLALAEGRLAQASADLERADFDLARATRLKAASALTGAQFEAARAGRAAAAGARQSAAAARDQALQQQAEGILRAPFDGVVVRRVAEVGDLARPGAPVLVLADLAEVKAVFAVSDRQLARLRPGTAVTLRSETLRRDFPARISSVSPTADPQSRLFPVEATATNPDGALRPGMVLAATPAPDGPAPRGVAVPLAAVTRLPGEAEAFAVFVIEQAVARVRRVTIDGVSGNALVVAEGLRPGEAVVVSGQAGLRDGDPVTVLP